MMEMELVTERDGVEFYRESDALLTLKVNGEWRGHIVPCAHNFLVVTYHKEELHETFGEAVVAAVATIERDKAEGTLPPFPHMMWQPRLEAHREQIVSANADWIHNAERYDAYLA